MFALPFVWVVNVIWFFPFAFLSKYSPPDQSPADARLVHQLRKYVTMSAIGALIWIIAIASWNLYFQLNRTTLDWADSITYILPVGRP